MRMSVPDSRKWVAKDWEIGGFVWCARKPVPCGHRLCDGLAWQLKTATTLYEWGSDFLDGGAVGFRLGGLLVAEPGAA